MPLLTGPFANLTLVEAKERAALIQVANYRIELDLSRSAETFTATTLITFSSLAGNTFLDLKAVQLGRVELDGVPISTQGWAAGRLPLTLSDGPHQMLIESTMAFRNDGEGLHRCVDSGDGLAYVYGMSFMDAAPSIYPCFDQPDLKATFDLTVHAPPEWTVVANSPGQQVEPGTWVFARTEPLATYFTTLVAGPYHQLHSTHDGIELSLVSRRSLAETLEKDAAELFTVTEQCFDEFHRLFGIRYPFGNYAQAFVPEFNAGAMENAGCITFRDQLLFPSEVPRGLRIQRAVTVAHEMAHQWFGNLVTPRWWDDLWLNESFAEYMGNRVTADVTEFAEAWVVDSYTRRQWGIRADSRRSTHPVAGNGALDAESALQDFDGISYTKGSAVLRQLNTHIGEEAFIAGVTDHFERHRMGNATMADLFGSWERAANTDLTDFTSNWLLTAGLDTVRLDRTEQQIVKTAPSGRPATRSHTVKVASYDASNSAKANTAEERWVLLTDSHTNFEVAPHSTVLIDPMLSTWARVLIDPQTQSELADLLPQMPDPMIRASAWNMVRSTFEVAQMPPPLALDLLCRGLVKEDQSNAFTSVVPWALSVVVPFLDSPSLGRRALHDLCCARMESANDPSLRLAAGQSAIATSDDVPQLLGWLSNAPGGLSLDLDLRWRMLRRLAILGGVDAHDLDHQFDVEPTAEAEVHRHFCRAALPNAEAKQHAWAAFIGERPASNYELEALGQGMWSGGLTNHTKPFIERYFTEVDDTVKVRAGWILAGAASDFFPHTVTTTALMELGTTWLSGEHSPALKRAVSDATDDVGMRLGIRDRWE